MADQTKGTAAPSKPAAGAPPDVGTVNSQITDAVATINTLLGAGATANAMAMVQLAQAQATALGMYQALSRQQSDATIGSAAVAALCAQMVGSTEMVGNLPPSTGVASVAEAQARAAIFILKSLASQSGPDAAAAAAALERIAAAASEKPATTDAGSSAKGTTAGRKPTGKNDGS